MYEKPTGLVDSKSPLFRRQNYGQFSRLDKALWNSTLMSFRPCMIVVILRPFVICLRAYNLFIHSLLKIFLMKFFFYLKKFFFLNVLFKFYNKTILRSNGKYFI